MSKSNKTEVAVLDHADHLPVKIAIPAGFSELPEKLSSTFTTPYVQFAYAISDSYRDLVMHFGSEIEEGDAVLKLPEPYEPILLNPFRFFITKLTEFWGKYDASGLTVASRRQTADDDGWQRTYETALLVIPPDESRLIPATCRFKAWSTDKPAKAVFDAIRVARTPEWEAKNPEILRCEVCVREPWSRVYGYAESKKNPRNNRPILVGQVHPVKSPKIDYRPLLTEFFNENGPDYAVNQAMYVAVGKQYERRYREALKKELVTA